MRTNKHARLALAAAVLAALPIPLLALDATDPDFRSCMREATDVREDELLSSVQTYNNANQGLLEERSGRYSDLWDLESDRDRRKETQTADREYRSAELTLRRERRERDENAKDDFNRAKRDCRDAQRDREREEDED